MARQGMTLQACHSSLFKRASAGLPSVQPDFVGLDSRVEAKLSSEKSLRLPSQEVEISEAAESPVTGQPGAGAGPPVDTRGTRVSSSVVPLHHFKGNSTVLGHSLLPEPGVYKTPPNPTGSRDTFKASLWNRCWQYPPHTLQVTVGLREPCRAPWTTALLRSHLQLWL